MDMKPKQIRNFNFTLGTSYQKLNTRTDKKLTIGATATFGNTGNMTTEYTNSTYRYADAAGTKLMKAFLNKKPQI
jgi:hypothetical protein